MIKLEPLKKIPFFRGLEESELAAVASVLQEKKIPKGNYILFAEDPASDVLFLAEGTAHVTLISEEGKEVVIYSMKEGDLLGEIAIVTGDQRSANVVATSDCLLYVIREADFKKQLTTNGGLAYALIKELAHRLYKANTTIEGLAFLDVYNRIYRTLVELSKPGEKNGEEILVIDKRPTHQELAHMVGSSREVVTRTLRNMESDGCITIQDKHIELRKAV